MIRASLVHLLESGRGLEISVSDCRITGQFIDLVAERAAGLPRRIPKMRREKKRGLICRCYRTHVRVYFAGPKLYFARNSRIAS
jgi:hypothetical protein